MTEAMMTKTLRTARRLAGLLLCSVFAAGSAFAAGGGALQHANVSLDDVASMQRGARLFFNYCAGCHSLQYMRYSRIAEDLQLDPKDVEKNFMFAGGKIGDHAISSLPAAD